MGEVRSSFAARARQDRGWTPQALASALRAAGLPGSSATIKRACAAGQVEHARTAGGHIRIDPAWVAATYPSLAPRHADEAMAA